MCLYFPPGSALLYAAENYHFTMERGRCHRYQAYCGYANYGKLNQPLQMVFLVPFFYAALPSFVSVIIIFLGMNRKLCFLKDLCFWEDQAGSRNAQSGFSVALGVFWLAECNFLPTTYCRQNRYITEKADSEIGLALHFSRTSELEHSSGFHFSFFSLSDSLLVTSCSSFLSALYLTC